tara:strand:- start:647 stop:916 length:270 start_codon:yes stop_codon:yes gene_type:complete
MSTKKNKMKYGSYLSKVGYLDIRQKFTLPKKVKNRSTGEISTTGGTTNICIFHGKHSLEENLKSKKHAEERALELIKNGVKYNKHDKRK